jgi:hypothetical protein
MIQILTKVKQENEQSVTSGVEKQIAAQIKADAYTECSDRTREGVQELFVHAARLSLTKHGRRKKRSRCILM